MKNLVVSLGALLVFGCTTVPKPIKEEVKSISEENIELFMEICVGAGIEIELCNCTLGKLNQHFYKNNQDFDEYLNRALQGNSTDDDNENLIQSFDSCLTGVDIVENPKEEPKKPSKKAIQKNNNMIQRI